MKMTPIEKRAARKARNQSGLDMNLVALIDIFTILIFFLMSSTGIEVLTNARSVKLPLSTSEKVPRQTIVVAVSDTDIVVEGRKVASVAEANALKDDLIPGLKAEFYKDLRVLGSAATLNQSLEKAGRVADFFELAELMCIDALHREESCGGHFRVEHATEEGAGGEDLAHVDRPQVHAGAFHQHGR